MILRTSKPKRSGLNFNYYEKKDNQAYTGTIVKLYDTNILIAENDYIKLNSGGFRTNHTKNVINDFLPSDYNVFQKKGEWYVRTPQGVIDFKDGMIINL